MGKGSLKVIHLGKGKVFYDVILSEEQEAVWNQIDAAYGEGLDRRHAVRMGAYGRAERELRRSGFVINF
jgi:hypothetical protein